MKVHVKRRRAGFSLTEMLVVVGIIAILLGIGVPSILYYQRELKLTELDDNARAVFIAAQNNLTALRSASAGELEIDTDTEKVGRPAQKTITVDGTQFWYVSTDVAEAEPGWLVLPGSIESDLAEGSYLVEFDPASGGVYGVFFVEKTGSQMLNESTYDDIRTADCRNRAGRKDFLDNKGIYLGYYGADGEWNVNRPDLQKLPEPKLELTNAEELRLEIKTDSWPTGIEASRVFASVSVSDGVVSKPLVSKAPILSGAGGTVVLDTLKTKAYSKSETPSTAPWIVGGSFEQLMKEGSDYIITPGADITVTVSIFYEDEGTGIAALPQSASVTTNSLFAARRVVEEWDPTSSSMKQIHTVDIAYGRHLQNLNESTSHVDSDITAAIQTREIDFNKAGGGIYSWADTYGYDERRFVPITNSVLDRYQGGGRPIKNLNAVQAGSDRYENAGLFGVFSGTLLEKVTLVDARVTGTNAGALAGTAQNADQVVVDGCQVYLTKYSNVNTAARIRGTSYVGGLIGKATNLMTQSGCFASTVVIGGSNVGGLVGGGDNMYVSRSYAAGHLSGANVGGLVGRGSATSIQNCYAAGTIAKATANAGGLSAGAATTRYSYAAVDYGEISDTVAVYGAVPSGAQLCNGKVAVHYLVKLGVNDQIDAANVKAITNPSEMEDHQALGLRAQFDDGNNTIVVAQPYNFPAGSDVERDPKLFAPYPYPTLNVGLAPSKYYIPHYGDWLEGSALRGVVAYYEQYETDAGLQTDFFYYERNDAGEVDAKGVLNATGSLYSDGYAFLSLNQLHAEGQSVVPMMVAIGQGAEMKECATTYLGTYVDGLITYYAYGLPNSVLDEAVAAEDYFLQLRVAGLDSSAELSSLWLNPHFGRAAYNGYGETSPGEYGVPIPSATVGNIAIRSVRQFNNMRKYKSAIRNWVQELDLDASAYRGHQVVDAEGYLTVGGLRVTTRQPDGSWKPVKAATLPSDYRLAIPPITMTSPSKGLAKDNWGGTYDGRGHTISNLSIGSVTGVGANNTGRHYAGLFCCISSSGAVKNVALTQCDVTGLSGSKDHYTGALAGYSEGSITNCTVTNTSVNAVQQGSTENGYIGGLVGFIRKGMVENCGVHLEGADPDALYEVCAITGAGDVGGLVGQIKEGNVRYCHAAVKVSGRTAGGLVGIMAGGKVSDSYAGGHTRNGVYLSSLANVSGTANAGGFTGLWSSGTLEGLCYTTCGVSGNKNVDVFAVATGTSVPTGCYAGGDVFVDGKAVKVSSYNSAKAITGTLPTEAEATQAAAHPYDTTLLNKYPYKPIMVGDVPMVHYGDWPYTVSRGPGFEWTPEPEKFGDPPERALEEATADWNGNDLTLTFVTKGDGANLANVFAPSGGHFAITTDLGYVMVFKAEGPNADGSITVYGPGGEKVGDIVPSEAGYGDDRRRTYELKIPTASLPPYLETINLGGYKEGYIIEDIKNRDPSASDYKPETPFLPGDTVHVDGDFSDWNGYAHQLLTYTAGNAMTDGVAEGSAFGDGNVIYLHVRNKYKPCLVEPGYSGTLVGVPLTNMNISVKGYDDWGNHDFQWWRFTNQAYTGPGFYKLELENWNTETWVLEGTSVKMECYLTIEEDGSQEIEMVIYLDELVGKENADKITSFTVTYPSIGGSLTIFRDPPETEP